MHLIRGLYFRDRPGQVKQLPKVPWFRVYSLRAEIERGADERQEGGGERLPSRACRTASTPFSWELLCM